MAQATPDPALGEATATPAGAAPAPAAPGSLTAYGAEVRALAATVGPSVAGLGRGWGHGSGVVVAPGLLLTVAHVLRGADVAVTVGGRPAVHGRVAGVDADLDLAVIAADTGDAPPVDWDPEQASAAAMGDPVVALADPGGRGLRATLGLVSAADRSFRGPRGRRIAGALEHTAPLPRGSAGGPLVSAGGGLLGLNSIRLEGGLILAVPADAALREAVDALAAGRAAAARPRLGVALASQPAARRLRAAAGLKPRDGLLVRAVQPGSPAAAAGIEPGDLLTVAGGEPLHVVDDLLDALQGDPETIEIGVVRGDRAATAVAHFTK